MNLFERLLYRRLCNEQPVDGGAAPAASEPSAPAGDTPAPVGDPSQQEGDKPQPVADGDKPADDKKPENDKQDEKRAAINQRVRLRSTSFRLPKA